MEGCSDKEALDPNLGANFCPRRDRSPNLGSKVAGTKSRNSGVDPSDFETHFPTYHSLRYFSFAGPKPRFIIIINSSELFISNRFYLLNIWSSWCVPCRQEHSFLMDFSDNKKVTVIGINYKDTKSNAKFFLDELGNPYEEIIFDKVLTVTSDLTF